MSNISVAVRMRPLNAREKACTDGSAICCELFPAEATIQMLDPAVKAKGNPADIKRETKAMTFDFLYDSSLPKEDPNYADQAKVFNDLGKTLCDKAFDENYNGCVFAYGLTGTGKTYTMMGYGDDKGLVPRVLDYIFGCDGKPGKLQGKSNTKCQISYMEFYNDRLRDLLDPGDKNSAGDAGQEKLQVRIHPQMGTYVSNLIEVVTTERNKAEELLRFGDKMKSVASTNMNATSSRSHTIFVIKLIVDDEAAPVKINLVDLAGRENEKNTAATGERLKELSFINKSLFELSNCIQALSNGSKSIPFRNNKLTMVLADSLQGHSRTSMMAAVTPAAGSYAETLTTLRFAAATKTIKTKSVVSANASKAEVIKALKDEIAMLKTQIETMKAGGAAPAPAAAGGLPGASEASDLPDTAEEISERLETNAEIIKQLNEPWQQQVARSTIVVQKQRNLLASLGIISDEDQERELSKSTPFLMNISDDPYLYGKLLYFLAPKQKELTKYSVLLGSDVDVDNICIAGGLGVFPSMAVINVEKHEGSQKGSKFTLSIGLNKSADAEAVREAIEEDLGVDPADTTAVYVNGKRLEPESVNEPVRIHHNDRIVVGHAAALRVVIPGEVSSKTSSKKVRDALFFDQHKSFFGKKSKSMPTSLEEAIEEIEDNQPTHLRPFVESVRELYGEAVAEALLKKIKQAVYFVDEANRITTELRGQDKLKFELSVIENVFDKKVGNNDRFELVVRLIQDTSKDHKESRLMKTVRSRIMMRMTSKSHAQESKKDMGDVAEDVMAFARLNRATVTAATVESGSTLDVCAWTWQKFMKRLQMMRDLYDRFHRDHLNKVNPVAGSLHHSMRMTSKKMKSRKPLQIGDGTLLPETVAEYLEENPQEDAWREFGPGEVGMLVSKNKEVQQKAEVLEKQVSRIRVERDAAIEQLKKSRLGQIQERVLELEQDISMLDDMARNLAQALHAK